jgi:hypothetical protein
MNDLAALLCLLIALDGPVGQGIPAAITRFDGPDSPAIRAEFVVGPDSAPGAISLDWFLDGGTLTAPVATTTFRPDPAGSPSPRRVVGGFPVELPEVTKPTRFRGVIRADGGTSRPTGTFALTLYPRDHFAERWRRLQESDVAITLVGEPGGWAEFLRDQGVAFVEGGPDHTGEAGRDEVLVVQASGDNPLPRNARAKAVFVYGGDSEPDFRRAAATGRLLWITQSPPPNVAAVPAAQNAFLELAESILPPNP